MSPEADAGPRRTIAIVQARMTSSRLPGKVLAPILGEPMLTHVMRRVSRASRLDSVVLAIPDDPADDPLAQLADRSGWAVARGPRDDVLARFIIAARVFRADWIVRITADCPLIDPEIIDNLVELATPDVDYVSNTLDPRTFPRGLDCEVFSRRALESAGREDHDPRRREHVTPYIYLTSGRYRLRRVANEPDESARRWCVDEEPDLELVRLIYGAFGHNRFGWRAALATCSAHPEWDDINRAIVQRRAVR